MEPVTWVLAVLGAIAFMVSAWVVMRSSSLKSAVEAATVAAQTWRDEAEAQKARGDRLEEQRSQERAEFRAALDELRDRVAVLEHDNERLKDLATGATAIGELRSLIGDMHAETMRALRDEGSGNHS